MLIAFAASIPITTLIHLNLLTIIYELSNRRPLDGICMTVPRSLSQTGQQFVPMVVTQKPSKRWPGPHRFGIKEIKNFRD